MAIIEGSIPRGAGFPVGNGSTFYVDSVGGSSSKGGTAWGDAKATLAQALALCTADHDDVIYVAAGHAETLTASLALSVAGVRIIGMGLGTKRPTITIGDAVGEAINITGANVYIENFIFVCGVDAQTWMIGIGATDAHFFRCDFREGASKQPLIMIDVGAGGAANAADRAKIEECYFYLPTAGDGDSAIKLSEVAARVEIVGCVIWGDFDDACIHNPTGKILTDLVIRDTIANNLLTGQHAVELVSACTGWLIRNTYGSDIAAPGGVDPGSCFSVECYHADAIDTSGVLAPIAT